MHLQRRPHLDGRNCDLHLGGESAEDAHGVDEVAQERHSDDLVDGLVQRIERQGQVQEDVRVR